MRNAQLKIFDYSPDYRYAGSDAAWAILNASKNVYPNIINLIDSWHFFDATYKAVINNGKVPKKILKN